MKSLKYLTLTFALLASVTVAQAGNGDDCHTKTVHGIWDCR